jgi:asparagine synthase (glutamine-hydrolysing)
MCGIAGFLHRNREEPCDEGVLRRMADTLKHRGPDGEGYFVSGNIAMGHRRLAVIDLNTGDQPMTAADGSLTIVFNGEIYNYLELREKLVARGHHFRTTSDTEVILASYQEWGPRCVEQFNGMWAFALWDGRERRLFCSRDRTGEKPFYYAVNSSTFVFGSEIKALFAYGVEKKIETETLDAYLCFTYVPGRQTFFKGVYKLQPGHSMIVQEGELRETAYWELKLAGSREARVDEARVLEEFEQLFENSVAIRMRSDVPFGTFLSGGLDSASVVATMSGLSDMPVRTCTIGFRNPEFDERHLARLVAHKFGTDHVERVVEPIDAASILSKLAWHFDEPFGDSSALPVYLVSQAARERVTVVLTGDGGDEVLSGYTIHLGEKIASIYQHLPGPIGNSVLPSWTTTVRRAAPRSTKRSLLRMERVVHSCTMGFIDRLESKQNGFTRSERAALIRCKGVRPAREYIQEAIAPVEEQDNFAKLNYWLTKVALPDDMLCKVDRASMAHSLETRAPFLDFRIIDLLASVSMRLKLNGFERKTILRKTIAKQLPAELLGASKRGFAVPLYQWLQNGTMNLVEEKALRAAAGGLLSKSLIEEILQEHNSGNRDAGQAIWTLSMLADHLS